MARAIGSQARMRVARDHGAGQACPRLRGRSLAGLGAGSIALLLVAAASVAHGAKSSPPALPFIDRDVCPLHYGCSFREDWVARRPLTAYAREGDPTRVAFGIAAGESFVALRADMYVTRAGIVVMVADLDATCEPPDCSEAGFRTGDVVYVLSYRGEGSYLISHRGRLRESEAFWNRDQPRDAIVREAPEMFWWVLVRNKAGREGWLRLKNTADLGIMFEEQICLSSPRCAEGVGPGPSAPGRTTPAELPAR